MAASHWTIRPLRHRLLAGAAVLSAILAIGGIADAALSAASAETLKVGVRGLPTNKGNPFQNFGIPAIFSMTAFFDQLTTINERGLADPKLAVSWQVKDDNTWIIKLRSNVTFSNGEAFNAAAVKATFDWLGTEKGLTTQVAQNVMPAIASTVVVDDLTLEIKTKAPLPTLDKRMRFVSIVAPKAWNDLGLEGFSLKPEGTGSYRLVEWKPDSAEAIGLPKSWAGFKDVDRINFIELPEGAARAQAVVSGQIDVDTSASLDTLEMIEKGGKKVFAYPAPRTLGISFILVRNGQPVTNSPFTDIRVRQAANYAVNKQAIVDNIYKGKGTVASQAAVTTSYGYDPTIPPYPYDPAMAKKLLTEAGFPNGIDVEMRSTGTDSTFVNVWEAAVADLAKSGIRVKYTTQPFAEFLKYFMGGDAPYEMFGFGHDLSGELDAAQALTLYNSCLKAAPYYCNQEEADLLREQSKEFNPDKRKEILSRLLRKNRDNAAILFLTEGFEAMSHSPRITNFKAVNLVVNYSDMQIRK